MATPNILVTSCAAKVPLLVALRGALDADAPDGVLWGADLDPDCVGRFFSDRFWAMPPIDCEGAADALVAFCERERIGLLVPTRDGELSTLATLRDRLAERGTYAAIGSPESIETCLDKVAFAHHCTRHGIPTPPLESAAEAIPGDRLVVKERRGAGSRSVAVDANRATAARFAEGLDEPVFQSFAPGVEHSIDCYVNFEGDLIEAAPRARVRVRDGESTVTETVEHPALVAVARTLAKTLDLRGHFVVQAFAEGDRVSVIECNARVGGASTLGFVAGVDTPRWALAEARGEPVVPRIGTYQRGLRLVRYAADLLIET